MPRGHKIVANGVLPARKAFIGVYFIEWRHYLPALKDSRR